jgi:hypothetical protein
MFVAVRCNLLKIRQLERHPIATVSTTEKANIFLASEGAADIGLLIKSQGKPCGKWNFYHNTIWEQINGLIARHERRWMFMDSSGKRLLVVALNSPFVFSSSFSHRCFS